MSVSYVLYNQCGKWCLNVQYSHLNFSLLRRLRGDLVVHCLSQTQGQRAKSPLKAKDKQPFPYELPKGCYLYKIQKRERPQIHELHISFASSSFTSLHVYNPRFLVLLSTSYFLFFIRTNRHNTFSTSSFAGSKWHSKALYRIKRQTNSLLYNPAINS